MKPKSTHRRRPQEVDGEVNDLESVEERRKSFMATRRRPVEDAGADTVTRPGVTKSIGQQFVESGGYKGLISAASRAAPGRPATSR
jgi:hypothetical protein